MTSYPASWSRSRHTSSLGKRAAAALVTSLLALAGGNAQGQDLNTDRFTFRAFGSLGTTWLEATGGSDTAQAYGAGAGEVAFSTDTVAGGQVNMRLNSQFDGVMQGVSRLRAEGGWDTRLSQAYVRYSPDDSLVLRAGRIGYDIYLLAESRQVGYSYLAVHPSPEFFGPITIDDIDGGDLTYTRRAGPGLLRTRLFGGEGSGELSMPGETINGSMGKLYGATFDYLFRGWTARLALTSFKFGADLNSLPDPGAPVDTVDTFTSQSVQLGVAYDDGPLQVQFLWGAARSDTETGPDFSKVYAMLGYRLQKWTPFVSFATFDEGAPRATPTVPGAPEQPSDGAHSRQRTATLGVRYDLNSHVDFKLQVERTSARDSALMSDEPAQIGGGIVNTTVILATMDFVF